MRQNKTGGVYTNKKGIYIPTKHPQKALPMVP